MGVRPYIAYRNPRLLLLIARDELLVKNSDFASTALR
jgi:hypothetical protein